MCLFHPISPKDMEEKSFRSIFITYFAYGSNSELDTQISLSGDLGYMRDQEKEMLQRNIGEVERMLKALIKSLENKRLTP